MEVIFYKTNSLKNALDKELNRISYGNGTLKEESSLINPVITFIYDTEILNCNYIHIPVFKRNYFIEDIIVNPSGIEIKCHVDVLTTYKNDIRNAIATITRSHQKNNMIPDNMILETPNRTTQFKKMGAGFENNPTYILTIGG